MRVLLVVGEDANDQNPTPTMDFNYSYSKSIDMGSDAERVFLFQGSFFGTGELYNPFSPGLFRAVSDYDMTHQFNVNWIYEIPLGRNRHWGSSWTKVPDFVLGGWPWSGLGKWTSGLPFGVQNGFQFPTKPKTGAFPDCNGDMNELAAIRLRAGCSSSTYQSDFIGRTFDYPFPGQVGVRNTLSGPGYFDFDMALRKNWEVFNVTNSVRFDVFSALPTIDNSGSFGKYSQTLTGPRVMEFMLRYSF